MDGHETEREPNARQRVRTLLDQMSDDVTLEDIQYALYVHSKVENGLRSAQGEEKVPHEKVMREMRRWLSESSGHDRHNVI